MNMTIMNIQVHGIRFETWMMQTSRHTNTKNNKYNWKNAEKKNATIPKNRQEQNLKLTKQNGSAPKLKVMGPDP